MATDPACVVPLCCIAVLQGLLWVLCSAAEYDELPVRHNEDRLNTVLAGQVRWQVDARTAGGQPPLLPSPHC